MDEELINLMKSESSERATRRLFVLALTKAYANDVIGDAAMLYLLNTFNSLWTEAKAFGVKLGG